MESIAVDPAAHERNLDSTSLITVIVVLAAFTMTFGAMIAVFVYRSFAPRFWGHLEVPLLLWITTALLLASSITFEKARSVLRRNNQVAFHWWMNLTLVLALAFLLGQVAAWWQLLHGGLVLAKNPHSWFIFLFSGLHGAHILLGLGGIVFLLRRTKVPASGPKFQAQTRVVAKGVSICWHYLDFLWVLMFALLLLWKR